MKTPYQKKYEELIKEIILYEPFVVWRKGVLDDFQERSDESYENFCDKIFEFSHLSNPTVLVVDERGYAYTSVPSNGEHHVFFHVLSSKELDADVDDIIVYIDLALKHLEEQLKWLKNTVL